MIDPRISLLTQAPSINQAINIFESALMNSQTRDLRQSQELRAQELQPFNLQKAQQGVDINDQVIAQNTQTSEVALQQRILKSVNDFALGNQSLINEAQSTGDFTRMRGALEQRKVQLQQQNLPTETTDDGIALIDAGQGGQVVSALGDAVNLFNQQSGRSSTKAFAPITDPVTGSVSIPTFNPNTNQVDLVPVDGATQETPQQKRQREATSKLGVETDKADITRKTSAINLALKRGGNAFDRLEPIGLAISNYDDAIAQIDAGAETGVIDQMLPSFRAASIKLDNIKKKLGLDVVGNTTFGALSESELKFALDSALPTGLQPAELKEWLIAKRDSQKKVKSRIEEAATFLSDGTHTLKDWIEYDKARQLNIVNQRNSTEQQQAPQKVAPQAQVPELLQRPAQQASQPQKIGRFTVEVVN